AHHKESPREPRDRSPCGCRLHAIHRGVAIVAPAGRFAGPSSARLAGRGPSRAEQPFLDAPPTPAFRRPPSSSPYPGQTAALYPRARRSTSDWCQTSVHGRRSEPPVCSHWSSRCRSYRVATLASHSSPTFRNVGCYTHPPLRRPTLLLCESPVPLPDDLSPCRYRGRHLSAPRTLSRG